MADSDTTLGNCTVHEDCTPFSDSEVTGILGTPDNAGTADNGTASDRGVAGEDCMPFNVSGTATATAIGEFSGKLTHCAATQPAEGPLLFGG